MNKTDIKRFFAYTVFDERGKNPEVEYRENPQGIVVKYSDHKQILDSMHNLLTEMCEAILKYDKYANWSYANIEKAQKYLQDTKEKL